MMMNFLESVVSKRTSCLVFKALNYEQAHQNDNNRSLALNKVSQSLLDCVEFPYRVFPPTSKTGFSSFSF